MTSFSSSLFVSFVSDASISSRGFRATFSASTSSETTVSSAQSSAHTSTVKPRVAPPAGCGGDLRMESGAFNSPNYPDPYPANVDCVWTVRSSPGNRLQLSFMSVSISIDASLLDA